VRRPGILMLIFGTLDLFLFYKNFPQLMRAVENYSASVVNVLVILLILSLLVSGPLIMVGNKIGFVVYYFQFPFRLAFFVVTFGFLYKILGPHPGTFSDGMLRATIFGLEAVRLMLTIQKNKVNI
jgi:hypothetical protein